MKLVLTNTFIKSLKKLSLHNRWYFKIIDAIRYDIPNFCKNIWIYRNDLYNIHSFDSQGSLRLLKTSIEQVANYIEKHGNEIELSKSKKIAKMRRAIELLNYHINDDFIEIAEKQLGKKLATRWNFEFDEKFEGFAKLFADETEEETRDNAQIYELTHKLKTDTWNELFLILKGQDSIEYAELCERSTDEERKNNDLWYKWFDGSGIQGWWD